MMTSDDKMGGWVKKGQNHDVVILEWSLTNVPCIFCLFLDYGPPVDTKMVLY